MGHRIGIVNYLELEPKPVLRHEVCDACGARFWGRRNACACCGGEAFHVKDAPDTGVLRAFTIVHRAAPGVPVPFAAAIVELDDATFISANLLSIELDPAAITLGQRVKMTTFVAGTDTEGTEAVAFGFIAVAEQEEALS